MHFHKFINEKVLINNFNYVKKIILPLKHKILSDPHNFIKIMNNALNKYAIKVENIKEKLTPVNPENVVEMGVAFTSGKIKIYVYEKYIIDNLLLDDEGFYIFIGDFDRVLSHELVHRKQFKKMKKDYLENMKPAEYGTYFSDKHEIMAFANQTVVEFLQQGFSLDEIKQMITKISKPNETYSEIHSFYLEKFKKDDPSFKRYMKYVYQYIEELW